MPLVEPGRQATADRPGRWVPWRTLLPAWAIAFAIALATFLLSLIPALGLPTHAVRFFRPLSDIPPVTTTRINVPSGDFSLPMGKPVSIRASVQRLGNSFLELYLSQDQQSWTRWPLQLSSGQAAFSTTSDRDLWYYLRGGDATTPI